MRGLEVDILLRISSAGFENGRRGHFQLLAPQLLVYLDLDRQAVAVEARHVRRVKTSHGLRLDDKIFKALIERVAQVQGPVGVGWAIVQQVAGPPSRSLA